MVKPEQIEKIKQFIKNNNCLYFEIIDSKTKANIFDFASDNADEIASEIEDYLSLFADGSSIDVVVHANQRTKTKGRTFPIRNVQSVIPASVNGGNAELLVKYALLEQSIKHEQLLREKDSIIAGFNDPDDEFDDDDELDVWYNKPGIKQIMDKFGEDPMGTANMVIGSIATMIQPLLTNNKTIITNQSVAGVDEDKLMDEYLKIDPDGKLVLKAIINLAKNKPDAYKTYKPILLNL